MNFLRNLLINKRNNQEKHFPAQPSMVGIGMMLSFLLGASFIGYVFRAVGLPEANIAIVFFLAVLLTARLTGGYFLGFCVSLLAAFFFNFLFMEPYYTFSVNTPSYIITFIIMVITSSITSTLTTHARQNAVKANEREAEAKALYSLNNRLTDATDIHAIAEIAASTICDSLNCKAECICFDESGKPEQNLMEQFSLNKQTTGEIPGQNSFFDWLISGREATLGVIRIPMTAADSMTSAQTHMLHAMIESTALAMDRFYTARQRQKTNEAIIQERYRGNLLQAISHDLRTPLAGIMGTAEMLMNMTSSDDQRLTLIKEIYGDADWLHALVENILSLTRLQDGKLVLHKQEEAAEEVVGAAIGHISHLHPEHEISVAVPDELLLVPMDAKLIRQVLINLLDNAIKHTTPGREIHTSVKKDITGKFAVFSVCDQGEGIEDLDLPNIFQMFYTSCVRRSDVKLGVGLGLTICDAIVKAHGGEIKAQNRQEGAGAEFIFTIPLEDKIHESK